MTQRDFIERERRAVNARWIDALIEAIRDGRPWSAIDKLWRIIS